MERGSARQPGRNARALINPVDAAFSAALVAAAATASGHAVVYKRDPRSAALWLVVIWLLPAAGPVLYLLFGINRVRRRAAALRGDMERHRPAAAAPSAPPEHFAPLARPVGDVAARPLLGGNVVEPLVGGAAAYPAMLDAIESARSSVALASYIFHADGIGARFVEALVAASRRGVAVRVLIDDVSCRFSRHSAP